MAFSDKSLQHKMLAYLVEGLERDAQAMPTFTDWLPMVTPQFTWNWPHLVYLQSYLERVASGDLKKLMIFMPPRHGKSEMTTIRFPVWWLERNPSQRIMVCAYNRALANKFSRNIRRIARTRISISSEKKSADEWETDAGGGVKASGVGSGVTGMGGNLIIIDDPVKSRQEANSNAYRNRCYNWYTDDIFTRLEPGAPIIIIQCLAGGSKVHMADGTWKNIEDVKPNDCVVSLNTQTKKLESKRVINAKQSGMDDTLKLRTIRHEVVGNENHPILTPNGWKLMGDIKVGDVIITTKGYNNESELPTSNINIDENFMWLFGFLFGDGWVTQWDRNNYDKIRDKYYQSKSWCICVAKGIYEHINQRVLELFQEYFGKTPVLKKKEGYYRLDCNSIGRELQDLGLIGKALTKRIPNWVYKAPLNYRQSFIKGMIDADGHKLKHTNDTYRIGSGNELLMEDFRLLAMSSQVRATFVRSYKMISQPPNSPQSVESNHVSIDMCFTNKHENKSLWVKDWYKGWDILRPERVKSIENSTHQSVYDLQVEDNCNFIANGVVVHNTRWHEDDLSGRILSTEDDWEVVSLPALANDENDALGRQQGAPLCPDRFSREQLLKIKAVLGRSFDALYQQSPVEQEGGLFKRSHFSYTNTLPTDSKLRFVRFWDKASTVTGDYTVGVLMAFDETYKIYYVIDVVRAKLSTHERNQLMVKVSHEDRDRYGHVLIRHELEPGSSGIDAAKATTALLSGFSAKSVRATGSKAVRAEPFQSQCEAGNVKIIKGSWNIDYINELCGFPQGKHDDQVDGSSGAFNELARARAFIVTPQSRR